MVYVPAERQGMALTLLRNRLPHRSDLLAVFGVAVFVCYSWSLLGFLNKLSSFLLYFTLGEIGNIFAFMMAFALLESLALTGILVLLSLILPSSWLRDGFAVKGLIIIVIATAASIIFQNSLDDNYPSALLLAASILVPLALMVGAILAVRSMPRLQTLLTNIQDRVLVMLFIYVPMGLLALLVVMYRNLL